MYQVAYMKVFYPFYHTKWVETKHYMTGELNHQTEAWKLCLSMTLKDNVYAIHEHGIFYKICTLKQKKKKKNEDQSNDSQKF